MPAPRVVAQHTGGPFASQAEFVDQGVHRAPFGGNRAEGWLYPVCVGSI
jgi:hypothetical protein